MAMRAFRSRVATRVMLSFLAVALIPVTIVAVVSFRAVTEQLAEQSRERLDRLAKSAGMTAMERLLWAADEADRLAGLPAWGDDLVLRAEVVGVAAIDDGSTQASKGRVGELPTLEPETLDRLGERPAIRITTDGSPPDILVAVSGSRPGSVVWARFDGDSLLTRSLDAADLPTTSGSCVLAAGRVALSCAHDEATPLAAAVAGRSVTRGVQELTFAGGPHLVAAWDIFLPSAFDADPWTAVVSESRTSIYAPISSFAWAFPLSLVLGICIIALLATVQIRRTLEPLKELSEGTERIARGELSGRVVVTSNDEFADLATSFNGMASQLESRFAVLDAGHAIDETALAGFDGDQIVDVYLKSCAQTFPGRRIAVVTADADRPWTHWATLAPGDTQPVRRLLPDARTCRARLQSAGSTVADESDSDLLGDLTPVGFRSADRPVALIPLRATGRLIGALAVGSRFGLPLDPGMIADASTLTGHATLGLSGARMVADLEDMSWGTIRAMARAVDAKSPWTAGHSERVTALAMALGRELGLDENDILLIERGGLLHDLGKIGVPASILDHPGGLTDEQFEVMKRHPVIGAEILEPVAAFAPILPLVRSHHERWDGSGYPDGLAGTEIHPLARILAVADVFDAMVSERPYRAAMDVELVHSIIEKDSGSSFEPAPVEALTAVLARGWNHSQAARTALTHV